MTTLTLHSRRTGFPARYEITGSGFPTTRIGSRTLRRGGEIVIDGARFELTSGSFGTAYTLRPVARASAPDGPANPVAAAERAGTTGWTIAAGDREYRLAPAPDSRDLELRDGDGALCGRIGRTGWSSRGIDAEFDGLDGPLAVFVLCLGLATGQRRRRTVTVAGG